MSKLLTNKPIICIVFVAVLAGATACGSSVNANQVDTATGVEEVVKAVEEAQPADLPALIAAQALDCITTDSGLKFISLIEGDGPKPTDGQLVKIQYTGRLVDGSTFNSAVGANAYIFTLGQGEVIPGWDEGIAMLNEGGKAMLFIPPDLGYGDLGAPNVAPDSLLIFDVELLAILEGSPASPADIDEDDFTETESGLKFSDVESGDGPSPDDDYLVTVHYTGWLSDGTKFDSSLDRDTPIVFRLGQDQVIPGWDEGIRTMQVGTQRQLVIPPELAYGEDGANNLIPPDETLIFDVELLSILRGSPELPTEIEDDDDSTETESGLRFYDLEVGDSFLPDDGSLITVHYTGWLSDGTKFDSSLDRGTPFFFRLGQGEVIPGWEEGIRTMGIGGIRQLTIPPALAYGEVGFGNLIPPDETIVFEIELVNIQ